jgi:predicted metal-dependent hydrolase
MANTLIRFLWKKGFRLRRKKRYSPRKRQLTHEGKIFHLKEIYDRVNERYFEKTVDVYITWTHHKISGARRMRRLGCYVPDKKLIRISTLLDDTEIPCYFIEFIVYHEMLHALYPPRKDLLEKRRIHHAKFREMERKFPEYKQAKIWEKNEGRKKFFLGEGHGRA